LLLFREETQVASFSQIQPNTNEEAAVNSITQLVLKGTNIFMDGSSIDTVFGKEQTERKDDRIPPEKKNSVNIWTLLTTLMIYHNCDRYD
jgi:hypothetical protein